MNWILGEYKKIASSRLGGSGGSQGGNDHSGHGHGQQGGDVDEKDVVVLE